MWSCVTPDAFPQLPMYLHQPAAIFPEKMLQLVNKYFVNWKKHTETNLSVFLFFFLIEQEGLVGIIYIDIKSIVKHIISIAITDEGKANWP